MHHRSEAFALLSINVNQQTISKPCTVLLQGAGGPGVPPARC